MLVEILIRTGVRVGEVCALPTDFESRSDIERIRADLERVLGWFALHDMGGQEVGWQLAVSNSWMFAIARWTSIDQFSGFAESGSARGLIAPDPR